MYHVYDMIMSNQKGLFQDFHHGSHDHRWSFLWLLGIQLAELRLTFYDFGSLQTLVEMPHVFYRYSRYSTVFFFHMWSPWVWFMVVCLELSSLWASVGRLCGRKHFGDFGKQRRDFERNRLLLVGCYFNGVKNHQPRPWKFEAKAIRSVLLVPLSLVNCIHRFRALLERVGSVSSKSPKKDMFPCHWERLKRKQPSVVFVSILFLMVSKVFFFQLLGLENPPGCHSPQLAGELASAQGAFGCHRVLDYSSPLPSHLASQDLGTWAWRQGCLVTMFYNVTCGNISYRSVDDCSFVCIDIFLSNLVHHETLGLVASKFRHSTRKPSAARRAGHRIIEMNMNCLVVAYFMWKWSNLYVG